MSNDNKKLPDAEPKGSASHSSVPSEWIATSEVEALVAKAVAEHTERLLGKMGASRDDSSAPQGGDSNVKFAEHLALAIAQLSDQGTGRKHIPPEIIALRRNAREGMEDEIIAARQAGTPPVYELRYKVYLEEMMVDPLWIDHNHMQQATQIEWYGVPNEAMQPANEPAQRIHKLFMDSIGEATQGAIPENLKVTAGGLVVIGSDRREAQRPIVGQPQPAKSDLTIRGRTQRTKTVNILGTLAPAAEQSL